MAFIPSQEQQAIFDYVRTNRRKPGRKALAVRARAGTGKCVHPDTLIHINGTMQRAEDIYAAFAGDTWQDDEGEWVLPLEQLLVDSWDENNGRFLKKPIIALYRQQVNEDLRRITLSDGSQITITNRHKLFNGFEWVNNIQVGDTVAIPSHLQAEVSELDLDFAELMGWLVAEGYDEPKSNSAYFSITMRDRETLKHIQNLINKVEQKFNLPVREKRIVFVEKRGTHYLKFMSKEFRLLLESYDYKVGMRSRERYVPASIMQANNEVVARFLRAYFDGEGFVSVTRHAVEASTASPILAKQIAYLLRRFGVWMSVAKVSKSATNGLNIKRDYYRFNIYSLSLRKYAEHIGFSIGYKHENLQESIAVDVNPNRELIPSIYPLANLKSKYGIGYIAAGVPDAAYFKTKQLSRSIYQRDVKPALNALCVVGRKIAANQHRPTVVIDTAIITDIEKCISALDKLSEAQLNYATVASVECLPYQGYVYDFTVEGTHNFVAENILCHNTTTVVELIKREDARGVYCAFNRDIVTEVTPKLAGTQVQAKTFHQLALGSLLKHLASKHLVTPPDDWEAAEDKYKKIIESLITPQLEIAFETTALMWQGLEMEYSREDVRKAFIRQADNLAHFLRVKLVEWDDTDELEYLVFDYGLDEPPLEETLIPFMVSMMKEVMTIGEKQVIESVSMDYDDMVYWAVRWDVKCWYHDWVFVDEAQDLSPMQRAMVNKVLNQRNGFIVIIGDDRQAIYRFVGADSDSFDKTVEFYNADVMPLTVTRRCASIIVEHAKNIVADFQAASGQQRGKIVWLDEEKFADHAQIGDMVVSRVKSPLIKQAIQLIAKEIPATILGGNIGASLIDLMERISKQENFSWNTAIDAVEEYRFERVRFFLEKEDESRADAMNDDCAALTVLLENSKSLDLVSFSKYVNSLFSNKGSENVVTFCTGHKSKGLEAKRVFLLSPEKMPLKFKNMHPEAAIQESNIEYVAVTRPKETLVYLTNTNFLEPYNAGWKTKPSYVQDDFDNHKWSEDGLLMMDDEEEDMDEIETLLEQPANLEEVALPALSLKEAADILYAPTEETELFVYGTSRPAMYGTCPDDYIQDRNLIVAALKNCNEKFYIDLIVYPRKLSRDEMKRYEIAPVSANAWDAQIGEKVLKGRLEFTVMEHLKNGKLVLQIEVDGRKESHIEHQWDVTPAKALANGLAPNPIAKLENSSEGEKAAESAPVDVIPTEPVAWAQWMLENKERVVILDTETTDMQTNPSNFEFIQAGAIDLDGNEILNRYIRPYVSRITEGAFSVHGINNALLDEKGATTLITQYEDFKAALKGKVIIAYNSPFDKAALENSLKLCGLEPIEIHSWRDAMRMYTKHNPNKIDKRGRRGTNWSLVEAVAQQGLEVDKNTHDALADVRMTFALIQSMAADSPERWQTPKALPAPKPVERPYQIDDLVKVKASGIKAEVKKLMPNNEISIAALEDGARLTLNRSNVELVQKAEDRHAPIIEESAPVESEEESNVKFDVGKMDLNGKTVRLDNGTLAEVIAVDGKQLTVQAEGEAAPVEVSRDELFSVITTETANPVEAEPASEPEIAPVMAVPTSHKQADPYSELERLMRSFKTREAALEFVEIIQTVLEEVYPETV